MSKFNGQPKRTNLTLPEKAERLARIDFELNGDFRNSPYVVTDADGIPHKATIRYIPHNDDSDSVTVSLEIVRPAEIVANPILWTSRRPEPNTEMVDDPACRPPQATF